MHSAREREPEKMIAKILRLIFQGLLWYIFLTFMVFCFVVLFVVFSNVLNALGPVDIRGGRVLIASFLLSLFFCILLFRFIRRRIRFIKTSGGMRPLSSEQKQMRQKLEELRGTTHASPEPSGRIKKAAAAGDNPVIERSRER